jgi:hypothetical protein
MKLSTVLVAVALSITSSCATSRSSSPVVDYAVSGVVTAGPTCPVQKDPPDPACDDRPVPGAMLLISKDGDAYGEIVVDSEGRFETRLPAGTYVLEPQPVEGLMGTAKPVRFEVSPNRPVDVVIQYDTGIR